MSTIFKCEILANKDLNGGKRLVECFNQKVAISYSNGYFVAMNDAFCKMILLIVYVHCTFLFHKRIEISCRAKEASYPFLHQNQIPF